MRVNKQSLYVVMLLLGVILLPVRLMAAYKLPNNDCIVNDHYWDASGASTTLLTTLVAANLEASNRFAACRRSITVSNEVNVDIPVRSSIVVNTKGSDQNKFHLSGHCANKDGDKCISKSTILDVSSLGSSDTECAITILDTAKNVTISNFIIKGIPAGMKGICVYGDGVELDNIEIIGGHTGIFIGKNANQTSIRSTVIVDNVDEKGIVIEDESGSDLSQTMIHAYGGDVNALTIDNNGIRALNDEQQANTIQITGPNRLNDYISTNNKYKVVFTLKKDPTQTNKYYEFSGYVSDAAADEGQCPRKTADVEYLQIFTPSQDNLNVYGFVSGATNVGGKELGYDEDKGSFTIRIPEDENLNRFIMMPRMGSTGGLGSVSDIITLSNDMKGINSGCDDYRTLHMDDVNENEQSGQRPGQNNGDPYDPENPTRVDSDAIEQLGAISEEHCRVLRRCEREDGCNQDAPEGLDSDGDGLSDNHEDRNFNCRHDANETNFLDYDTDCDGIPDGMGGETICQDGYDAVLGSATRCTGDGPEGSGELFADPDGDGIPNALDSESDGDGINDGYEDRNRFFNQFIGNSQTQGLWYRVKNIEYTPMRTKKEDGSFEVDTCELGNNSALGVRYERFLLTCADEHCIFIESKRPLNTVSIADLEMQQGTYLSIETLACRNKMLSSPVNFNGHHEEGNYETDAYNADTDGDGISDGVDNCPLMNSAENVEECQYTCQDKYVYYTVDPAWVNWSDGHDMSPLSFKDEINWDEETGADQVPDLLQVDGGSFESISTKAFGDMDHDGIPDVIENPTGACDAFSEAIASNPASQRLKYFSSDSDGDGILDGVDVCPESYGLEDNFVEDKPVSEYSCDPFQDVYAKNTAHPSRRALAAVLDRDQDSLKDAEEDLDRDGRGFIGDMNALDPITRDLMATIETNPLSVDSDKDGIDDVSERTNSVVTDDRGELFTSPRDGDTDNDGLKDGEEDRDGVPGFSISIIADISNGCSANEMQHDTDPTTADTDGDGLSDKVELQGDDYSNAQAFYALLDSGNYFNSGRGEIDAQSNPVAWDSDGDGLSDGQEYDGEISYNESNPCLADSDGDQQEDSAAGELGGCELKNNKYEMCEPTGDIDMNGPDSDGDKLSDACEILLGTDPMNDDTDGDQIKDGDEDANHNCHVDIGESSPVLADTDKDGLVDGYERHYGTRPDKADTDGDCIPDGIEDENQNGEYDSSTETSAIESDTDDDGLVDGHNNAGIGEDLNCNGLVDLDENGFPIETNPLSDDSDNDGHGDKEEMYNGGRFNKDNAAEGGSANTAHQGCSLAGNGAPMSQMWMLLGMAGLAIMRMRRKNEE